MSEQIEEIFAYYGKQRDKSSQEMVIALLRELQEAEGCITPELKVRVIETTEITDKFFKLFNQNVSEYKRGEAGS